MSDQDVFGKKPEDNPGGDPAPTQTDPFADQLSAIKNEDGVPKYKDTATALKALNDSQQFIEQLKAENAARATELEQAREELAKMGSIEDFVAKITPTTPAPAKEEPTSPQAVGMSEDQVASVIEARLQQQAIEAQQTANLRSVVDEVTKVHGEKAREHIAKVAGDLGMDPADIKKMSMSNPQAALRLLGGTGASAAPSTSTLNSLRPNTIENPTPTWEVGAARGGLTNKELVERWRQVGTYTAKRIGLET